MEVRLTITASKGDPRSMELGREYVFAGEQTITIGRGDQNDVPLTDPERTVSRNHARIVATREGYVLEDHSKNFTYVNDERLESGQRRLLRSGDAITLGNFTLLYSIDLDTADRTLVEPPEPDPEPPRENPFGAAVDEVFQSLGRLFEVYEAQDKTRRADDLFHTVHERAAALEGHSAMVIFLNAFSKTEDLGQPYTPPPSVSPHPANEEITHMVVDTLVSTIKTLIRIPYEFRGEFIGHTMWQDEASTFLYEGNAAATKDYLLDPSSTVPGTERKLDRVREAANRVAVHQLGMLEGYNAVVREGLQHLLLEVDPELIERHVAESGILYGMFPILRSKKVLRMLKKKIAEMRSSDWSVSELRVYRPVFNRAYMAMMGRSEQERA